MIKDQITDGMNRIIEILRQDQSPNGSWNYPFETGISTDCYMIILLRSLDIHEENLINQLTETNHKQTREKWSVEALL